MEPSLHERHCTYSSAERITGSRNVTGKLAIEELPVPVYVQVSLPDASIPTDNRSDVHVQLSLPLDCFLDGTGRTFGELLQIDARGERPSTVLRPIAYVHRTSGVSHPRRNCQPTPGRR